MPSSTVGTRQPESASRSDMGAASEEAAASAFLAVFNRLPANLGGASIPVEELHHRVDESLKHGRAYLKEYPSGAHRLEILSAMAYLITANYKREMIDRSEDYKQSTSVSAPPSLTQEWQREYLGEALHFIEQAMALDPPSDKRLVLLNTKGQTLFWGKRYADAVETYSEIQKRFPDDPKATETHLSLIVCLIRKLDYDGAIRESDRFLAKHMDSDEVPHVLRYKSKAMRENGDAQGALELWRRYGDFISRAAAGKPVDTPQGKVTYSIEAQKNFRDYMDRFEFERAFLEYAVGNSDRAQQLFTGELESLQVRDGTGQLSQTSRVFLIRVQRLVDTLNILQGKDAPPLELGNGWLHQDLTLEPSQHKGQVLALYFAPYGYKRGYEFAQELQRIYTEQWGDGLRAVWISFTKGSQDVEAQLANARVEAKKLGLTYAAGMDLDPEAPVLARYNVMRGTSTLVVIDRQGKVAWYKMDPTYRDFKLARKVLTRLLNSS
ncbi:MAG: hypothetical protein V3T77_04935 [Planctomycetota bacterium]